MNNQRFFHLNLSKQSNKYSRYVYDLGFTGKADFSQDFFFSQIKKEDRTEEQIQEAKLRFQEALKISRIYRNHDPLDDDILPATLYTAHGVRKDVVLPDFFHITDNYLIMSKAFADVLLSCNLGKTKIIPIRFFDLVSQEYVNETTYYLLNVAEKYQYFLPDLTQPKPYFQFHQDGVDVYFPATTKAIHDNYVYSRQALSCPVDLWADPSLLGKLYISETLMKSLKQAGFTKIVNLWECQLADV